MALMKEKTYGVSQYCTTAVPVAGTPTTAVCASAIPVPNSNQANQIMVANCRLTLPIAANATLATDDAYRLFILPAGHVVTDASIEVLTAATAGTATIMPIAVGAIGPDGATAGTADAPLTASAANVFTAASLTSVTTLRKTLPIPADATSAATKAYSLGIPSKYDRMIGLITPTVATVTNPVLNVQIYYAAV